MMELLVTAATRKAFAAGGHIMPENINVARYIFAGPLSEGEAIVRPFCIQGIYVPLFVKHTDSPTKVLIAPMHGLCPGVIRSMIKDAKDARPLSRRNQKHISPVPLIPIGLYAESSH
ncbi:MAG: hypothetical protein NTZ84_03545 [Candidatus Nealsonbacteria bacterium]|nr:hypothetical protein [Candidatus Nealsonbacteria bacterium]